MLHIQDVLPTKVKCFGSTLQESYVHIDMTGQSSLQVIPMDTLETSSQRTYSDYGGTQENAPGACFHRWLLEHQLKLPCTFAEHHDGDQHATYISPDGQHETRIDYIAVPNDLVYTKLCSTIDFDIDLSIDRTDHLVAKCDIAFQRTVALQNISERFGLKYNRQDLTKRLREEHVQTQLIDQHPLPPWTIDPHLSAEILTQQTQGFITAIAPQRSIKRRKTQISDQTWALVDEKKAIFKQLQKMQRVRMKYLFRAWKEPNESQPDELCTWIKLHDIALAQTTHRLGQLSKLVTQEAVRTEDVAFYQNLAAEAGRTYTQEGLTGLWKKIKATLPKNKLKQSTTPHDNHEEMLYHFEQLEAGTTVQEKEILNICLENNCQDLSIKPNVQFYDLHELPTLYEVEEMCLRQKSYRAPGPDGIPPELCRLSAPTIAPGIHNVMMKSVLSSIEPSRFKGGHLQAIWKRKGSPQDPSTFRGILLADSYAKILHAWTRRRLLPTLIQRQARGQIGGLPAQQTITAMQVLRLHSCQARQCSMSTANLFIDMKAAFHHLLRELVFIRRRAIDKETLDKFVDPLDFDNIALAQLLEDVCNRTPADIPPALREFLHDLHRGTWFKLDHNGDNVTMTARGTRPGSPMADISFNLLMSRIMTILEEKLDDLEHYVDGKAKMQVDIPPISWVDDLAVPIACGNPSNILPLLEQVTSIVHSTFRDHGLTMNFEAGKTEAVVMFRGAGANHQRTTTFDKPLPPCLVVATPTHLLRLRIVASYKHLGARFAMDAELNQEINQRMAAARQAFEEMKRPIFKNKALMSKVANSYIIVW